MIKKILLVVTFFSIYSQNSAAEGRAKKQLVALSCGHCVPDKPKALTDHRDQGKRTKKEKCAQTIQGKNPSYYTFTINYGEDRIQDIQCPLCPETIRIREGDKRGFGNVVHHMNCYHTEQIQQKYQELNSNQ